MTEPHNPRSEAPVSSQVSSQGRDRFVRDRILDFLRERPGATVREVGEAVGLRSSSSAWEQLGTLERKGLIKRENCPRCDGKIWKLTKGVSS